jgi:GAF domain-containing protein
MIVVEGAASRMRCGDRELIAAVLRDVTEQRARDRREHLLAEAATRLSPRLEYDEQLATVAHLAMTEIGDWAILDMLDEPDSAETDDERHPRLIRLASLPTDRRLGTALRELAGAAVRWNDRDPAMESLRTARPFFVPDVSAEWIDERYGNDRVRQMLRRIAPRSLLVVPLLVDARAIGALTIGMSGERRASECDFVLAQLLADRAAASIEVSRLFRRVQGSVAARAAVPSVMSPDVIETLGIVTMNAQPLRDDDAAERHRPAL